MPTKGEELFMKLLKIENGQGLYTTSGDDYSNIIDIVKEDIFKMLELVYHSDEIEFEKCDDKNINNNAAKIIYESIYSKLIIFKSNKEILKNKIENENSELLSKYQNYDKK